MEKIYLISIVRYTYAGGIDIGNFPFETEKEARAAFKAAKDIIIKHNEETGVDNCEYSDYKDFFQSYIPFEDADEISVHFTEKEVSTIGDVTDFTKKELNDDL